MKVLQYYLKDDGVYPNNKLPVILYKRALKLPLFFAARQIKKLFQQHNWTNNWRNGIYTYHHYHSNTHEVMAVIKGQTTLLLGGDKGRKIKIEKGDVILIPAGVAHKNLGKEKDVICIGGYPQGKDFDMNYGREGERPQADKRIAKVRILKYDPVSGEHNPLNKIWRKKAQPKEAV